MNYIEVSLIVISPEDYLLDLFIQDLADVGFESFQETEMGFKAYVPSHRYSMEMAELKVIELFQHWIDKDIIRYEIGLIPSRNWNREWESNFEPINIGSQLFIRAPFHEAQANFQYELIIEPKMAFGTGHHETTRLMASFLLEQQVVGKTILDMGTGTGILAILADKMGAKRTLALDIDENCIMSAMENAVVNRSKSIQVIQGDVNNLQDSSKFDIIMANINRNVLLQHLPFYSKFLVSGGNLFLSGFYEGEDLEMILEEARRFDLKYLFHNTLHRWCAAQFYK